VSSPAIILPRLPWSVVCCTLRDRIIDHARLEHNPAAGSNAEMEATSGQP